MEAFLTFEKLGTLIYDLILVETWRERVYPLLLDLIVGEGEKTASDATRARGTRCYFVLRRPARAPTRARVLDARFGRAPPRVLGARREQIASRGALPRRAP